MANQSTNHTTTTTSTTTTNSSRPTLKPRLHNLLNTLLPPSRRATLTTNIHTFANTRPYLTTFLLLNLTLSGFPLAIFLTLSLTTTVFALLTGILLGVIGALVFVASTLGFALVFVLLPTLVVTTFSAVVIWGWAVAAWFVVGLVNGVKGSGGRRSGRDGVEKRNGRVANGSGGKAENRGDGENGARNETNGTHAHAGNLDVGVAKTEKMGQSGNGDESQVQTNLQMKSPRHMNMENGLEKASTGVSVKEVTDDSEVVVDVSKGDTGIVA